MLEKNVIKMQQSLLGLFKGKMVLSLRSMSLWSFTKHYRWQRGDSNKKMTGTSIKIKALCITASLSFFLLLFLVCSTSSSSSFYSLYKSDKGRQTYDSVSYPTL